MKNRKQIINKILELSTKDLKVLGTLIAGIDVTPEDEIRQEVIEGQILALRWVLELDEDDEFQ